MTVRVGSEALSRECRPPVIGTVRQSSRNLKKPPKVVQRFAVRRDERNDEHCYAGSVSHASNHVAPIAGVDPCSCNGRSHEIDKRAEPSRAKNLSI
jgi:hypothetical protein